VPLYLFVLDQGNSEREVTHWLEEPPAQGQPFAIEGSSCIVTGFRPVPEDEQEAAGHAGVVLCQPADP
jgi:hypothetical protein